MQYKLVKIGGEWFGAPRESCNGAHKGVVDVWRAAPGGSRTLPATCWCRDCGRTWTEGGECGETCP